jgi:hypothetical protein
MRGLSKRDGIGLTLEVIDQLDRHLHHASMHGEIKSLGLGDDFKRMKREFLELTQDGYGGEDLYLHLVMVMLELVMILFFFLSLSPLPSSSSLSSSWILHVERERVGNE